MSDSGVSTDPAAAAPEGGTIDMNLEVMTLPVSDVDRAKAFYQSLGWRLENRQRDTAHTKRQCRRRRCEEATAIDGHGRCPCVMKRRLS